MSDQPPTETSNFRWFVTTFTTREHFLRFMATGVLLMTLWLLLRGTPVPEGWWGILGMVIGYFFRGGPGPETR